MIFVCSIFRASDGLALCANTDVGPQSPALKQCFAYVKILSKKLFSFPDRCTLQLEGYKIHFITALDQTFMTLTDEGYPTVLSFCFLNELQREFLVQYDHEKIQAARRPYTFMAFDPVIQKAKQRYNSPRNLSTRVNLSDMSHELKLRPPYSITEGDVEKASQPKNNFNHQQNYRPAYHPDYHFGGVTTAGWFAIALNVFCGFLNFVRGSAIISHGHFDDADRDAYKHGCAFLLACVLIGFQVALLFRSLRMRTTVAALTWLSLTFCIVYVAQFRNLLQIIFHSSANAFITVLIYRPAIGEKPPDYTV